MTQPAPAHPTRSGRRIGAFLLVTACALACTLPFIGAFAAGTVLGFLDAPAWLAVVLAVATVLALRAARRRLGNGRVDGKPSAMTDEVAN